MKATQIGGSHIAMGLKPVAIRYPETKIVTFHDTSSAKTTYICGLLNSYG